MITGYNMIMNSIRPDCGQGIVYNKFSKLASGVCYEITIAYQQPQPISNHFPVPPWGASERDIKGTVEMAEQTS